MSSRALAMGLRVVLVVASFFTAFWWAVVDLQHQIAGGDPCAYLAVAPLLALTIGLGNRSRPIPMSHSIGDRQSDWLIALPVLVVALGAGALLNARLGAFAQLWRVDLLAGAAWCWAMSTLFFGLRPTTRHWRAWLFLLLCWPAPYRIAGFALGGTISDFAALNVVLCALVVWLALVGRTYRWTSTLGAGVLAAGLAYLIPDRDVLWSQLTPLVVAPAVVGTYLLGHIRKSGSPLRESQPSHLGGGITVGIVAAASVATMLTFPRISEIAFQVPVFRSGPVVIPAAGLGDWQVTARQSYAEAARYYGRGSTLERYALTSNSDGSVAYVDLLTTDSLGRLRLLGPTMLYGLEATVRYGSSGVSLGGGRTAQVTFDDPTAQTSSDDPPWLMLRWRADLGDGRYQQVIVLAPQRPQDSVLFTANQPRPGLIEVGSLADTGTYLLRGAGTLSQHEPAIDTDVRTLTRTVAAAGGLR